MPAPTNFEGTKVILKDTVTTLPVTLQITSGTLTGAAAAPADGTVTDAKLAVDAVTNTKLAANAVTNPKIANGAVDDSKISGVDGSKLAASSVTDAKIISLSGSKVTSGIDGTNLNDGSVSNAKIGSLDGNKITQTTIGLDKLYVYATSNLLRNGSFDEDANVTSAAGWQATGVGGPAGVVIPAVTTLITTISGDGHGDPTFAVRPPYGVARTRYFNNNSGASSGAQYSMFQDIDFFNTGLSTTTASPSIYNRVYLSGHYKCGTNTAAGGLALVTLSSIRNGSTSASVTFSADSSAGTGVAHWRLFTLALTPGGSPSGTTSLFIRVAIGANTNDVVRVYLDDLVLISNQTHTVAGG